MKAEQLVSEGNLVEALKALQDSVRKDPSNAKYRVFLFQLLSVQGNWSRALNQLNVAAELDIDTLPMAQTYREALQCEALRSEIFAGKRAPLVFGDPAPWVVQLLEAIRIEAQGGHAEQVAQMRAHALEQAPASAGSINGERFEWLADTDQRLGPILEAVVNGKYYWIPLHRLHKITIEAPTDLRDAVWTAALLTLSNGGEAVALIPTRYNGTEQSTDSSLLMARRTEWTEANGKGLGQRMFATDVADYALMDIRSIEFDEVIASESGEASETSAADTVETESDTQG